MIIYHKRINSSKVIFLFQVNRVPGLDYGRQAHSGVCSLFRLDACLGENNNHPFSV
jgi:hypothetical protein